MLKYNIRLSVEQLIASRVSGQFGELRRNIAVELRLHVTGIQCTQYSLIRSL